MPGEGFKIASAYVDVKTRVDDTATKAELAKLGRTTETVTVKAKTDRNSFKNAATQVGSALSGLDKMGPGLTAILPALGGIMSLGPGVAAAIGGVGTMFGFAALGAGAFAAAAIPAIKDAQKHMKALTTANGALAKAQQAVDVAKGPKQRAAALLQLRKAQDQVNIATQQFTPAESKFETTLTKAKNTFQDWTKSLEPITLPVIGTGLQIALKLMPMLTPVVKAVAGAFLGLETQVSTLMSGRAFRAFMAALATLAGGSIKAVGTFLLGIGTAFMNIATALTPAVPLIDGAVTSFGNWLAQVTATKAFRTEVGKFVDEIPAAMGFFTDLGKIGYAAVKGVLSVATPLWKDIVQPLVVFLAHHAKDVTTFAGAVTGFMLAVKGLNLVLGAMSLIANPFALLALPIAAVLLPHLGDLSNFINKTVIPDVKGLGKRVGGLFDDLSPAVHGAGVLIGSFFNATVGPLVKTATGHIGGMFGGVGGGLKTASKEVDDFFQGLAGKHLKPKHATTVQDIVDEQTGIDPTSSAKAGKKLHDTITSVFSGKIKIDPSNLGKQLSDALITAVGWIGKNTVKFTATIISFFAGLPWARIGKDAVYAAVPFVIGFVTNLQNALLDEVIHHPLDVVEFILALIPLGRGAGAIIKGLEKALPESKLIVPLAKMVLGPIEKAGALVERGLGKVFGPVGKAIWGGIKDGFGKVFPDAAKWLEREGLLPITRLRLLFASGGERAGGAITSGISRGASKVTEVILNVIRDVTRPFANAGRWLVGKGRDAISGLFSGIDSRWGDVSHWLGGIGGRALNAVGRLSRDLYDEGVGLISGLYDGVSARWGPVFGWLKRIPSRIANQVVGWAKALLPKGGALIQGLYDGIKNKMVGVGDWVKSNIVDPIVTWVRKHFGIASPSTVFAEIGGHMISGLLKGLVQANPEAVVKKVFGSVPKALASMIHKGVISAAHLPGKAVSALRNLGDSVLNSFGLSSLTTKKIRGHGTGPTTLPKTTSQGGTPELNRIIAQQLLPHFGWNSTAQWNAFDALEMSEAGYNQFAQNPVSTAFGQGQFLDSTWGPYGPKTSDPYKQLYYMDEYIRDRFGDPITAWAYHLAHNSYDSGGKLPPGMTLAYNGTGKDETIRTHEQEKAVQAQLAGMGLSSSDINMLAAAISTATAQSLAGTRFEISKAGTRLIGQFLVNEGMRKARFA